MVTKPNPNLWLTRIDQELFGVRNELEHNYNNLDDEYKEMLRDALKETFLQLHESLKKIEER